MRRGLDVAIALVAVLLLVKPSGCFARGVSPQKAMVCCREDKCIPRSNSGECCKHTAPDCRQVEVPDSPGISPPVAEAGILDDPDTTSQEAAAHPLVELGAPPGSPPDSGLDLPLLV